MSSLSRGSKINFQRKLVYSAAVTCSSAITHSQAGWVGALPCIVCQGRDPLEQCGRGTFIESVFGPKRCMIMVMTLKEVHDREKKKKEVAELS